MMRRGNAAFTPVIIAIILLAPAVSRAQFEVVERGFAFETPGFLASAGLMAYDGSRHRLAISDEAREAILVFDLTDRSYQTIEWTVSLKDPVGLAYDRSGVLYISQAGSRVIAKIAPDISEYDSLILDGDFAEGWEPGRLAVTDNGDLFVVDTEHKAVYRFDNTGKLAQKITDRLRRPDGIYVKPSGEIYIADKGVDPIMQFSPNGKYVRNLSRPEDPTQQSSFSASGLAVDQRGWFYTLDATHNKIVRYDPTGISRIEWTPEPPFFPRDIVIDKYDQVYVLEGGLGKILILETR